jgi:hypothetical protein
MISAEPILLVQIVHDESDGDGHQHPDKNTQQSQFRAA